MHAIPKILPQTGSDYVSAISSGNAIAQANILNSGLSNYVSAITCSKAGHFLTKVIHGEFLTSEQKCEAANILLAQDDSFCWVAAADLLAKPNTDEETELVSRAMAKIQGTKLYKIGNTVYKDKKNYSYESK